MTIARFICVLFRFTFVAVRKRYNTVRNVFAVSIFDSNLDGVCLCVNLHFTVRTISEDLNRWRPVGNGSSFHISDEIERQTKTHKERTSWMLAGQNSLRTLSQRTEYTQQFFQLNCLFCIRWMSWARLRHCHCHCIRCQRAISFFWLYNLFDFEFVNILYLIKAAIWVLDSGRPEVSVNSKIFNNGKVWHQTRLQQQRRKNMCC